jgi:hypothetical protein
MRAAVVLGVFVLSAAPALGQKKDPPPPARYNVEADLDAYPQDTPKAALASVIKAIDARRFSYLAAQLADPDTVDKRVQELGGRFESYVKLVADRFADDPEAAKQLRRFLSEGAWEESGETASVKHKEIRSRQVFFRKIGSRWFLEDRTKPAK